MPKFVARILPLTTLAIALAACGGAQMTLESPVDAAAPVPVDLSKKVITLGDMTLTRTKGGMVKKVSGSAGPWGGERISQEFDFETSDGWKGSCAFSNGAQSIAGFEIAASGGFNCTLRQGEATWTLAMEATNVGSKRLEGTLSGGEETIDVKLSREVDKGISRFVGYGYRYDGAAVAALQTAKQRQLWMVEGTDPALASVIRASVGAFVFSRGAVNAAVQ
ncbi:MAG: hypothetical protein AAGF11_22075 [Myxococcota bacterium]